MTDTQTRQADRLRQLLMGTFVRPGESALHPQEIANGVLPALDDLLIGLDAVRSRNADPASEINNAFSTVARLTSAALDKLQRKTDMAVSLDEILAVEAVIRADGSRPSLIVEQGWVDCDNPFAQHWLDQMVVARDGIRRFTAATGRIQPRDFGDSNHYFGTGFYARFNQPAVITNRHVALDALKSYSTLAGKPTPTVNGRVLKYEVAHGLEIDFNGELGSTSPRKVNVVEIRLPAQSGVGLFGIMDVAIMVLDKDSQALPEPVALSTASAFEQPGGLHSFCAIGFSGKPNRAGGSGGIDWDWIEKQLFQETYGVKRLAPGLVHQAPGTIVGDSKAWVLGHDATTLGGNSGSGLFTWLDGGEAFALHFAGTPGESNFAHGFSTADARAVLDDLVSF